MSVTALPVTPAEYRRGALLVTAAIVVWSTAGVLARWVDVDPWTTLFWRSVFAAISLLAYLAFRDGRGMFDGFRRLGRVGIAMALCFAISMICFINALALTTVAAVLVFQAAAPLFAAILAWMFLRERVSRRTAIAIALSMLGVGLIVSTSGDAGLISVLESVLAPLWVWFVFAENPGTLTLIGGAIVIAAVTWAATGERQ